LHNPSCEIQKKISFGGIPNSRNVLFLQIFLKLKGAAKPSAGNTSALHHSPKAFPTAPTFSGIFYGTFSGTLLNLTWLCTKASQTFSGTFGTFFGTSLNLTRRLHQCTPELFWAEDPISLRCWGKTNMT